MEYSLLVIVLPFVFFLLLGLLRIKMILNISGIIGTVWAGICTIVAYFISYQYFFGIENNIENKWKEILSLNIKWFTFTDKLQINFGILLDPISVMMLVVITTVSLMVHIYSLGYMKNEKGVQRYYAFLALFIFSMLGLVVSSNIFQMYIFWELVGVSSYLLIGFYYTKSSAVYASKKAFIVTRFADLGFLIGILILSYYTKTFDFKMLIENNAILAATSMEGKTFLGLSIATCALVLIFIGAAGKSAVFPFHIWLPDAMEGPTPISALLHAATMVVSGVYLIARLFPLYFFCSSSSLKMIVYLGSFTALFGSIIAITQNDIKHVLAFSTISQISYMMVALGVSGYSGNKGLGYMASMFHLFTHAFFKALLFLGSGSVIHTVHSNKMNDMGGLHKYMPITSITFFIACLAIVGVPPFSGFYSKEEILVAAFHYKPIIFWILWVVAGFTAFYMFRLYFCVFWNNVKTPNSHCFALHESPITMTFPLLLLSFFSIFSGLIPFSFFVSSNNVPFHICIDWGIAFISIMIIILGILVAMFLYLKNNNNATKISNFFGGFYKIVLHKCYLDEIWLWITRVIIFKFVCESAKWFEQYIIDSSVNNLGWIIQKTSLSIRKLQSGQLQFYAWIIITSLLGITVFSLFL